MGLFNKIFKQKIKTEIIHDTGSHINSDTSIPVSSESTIKSAAVSKHNIYDAEISQYSVLPRYYYIQGKRYDIDSPESVSGIPLCETSFEINGENWGIDTILREHVNRYYSHIPDELKSACYPKISELEWNGYLVESRAEKEARMKQQEKLDNEQNKLKQITNSDMEQFTNIPYDLSGKLELNYRSLFMEFKESDINIFLDEISSINEFVKKGCDMISTLPQNLHLSDLKNPIFKCTPYTDTGKLSKYPLSLHAVSLSKEEDNAYYRVHKSFPDMCGCELFYLKSGLIGKANIYFRRNTERYHFYLLRKKDELILSKIECSDITTGITDLLYKQ